MEADAGWHIGRVSAGDHDTATCIDDSLRLGPVDDGWRVALSVLTGERQAIAGGGASMPGTVAGRSVAAAAVMPSSRQARG